MEVRTMSIDTMFTAFWLILTGISFVGYKVTGVI